MHFKSPVRVPVKAVWNVTYGLHTDYNGFGKYSQVFCLEWHI